MPNNRYEFVEDEFLTSIDHYNQFYVNLLFDRFIYRPMSTHMGNRTRVNHGRRTKIAEGDNHQGLWGRIKIVARKKKKRSP